MKQLMLFGLAAVLLLGLSACSNARTNHPSNPPSQNQQETHQPHGTPDTITITSLNENREAVELEVPYNPQRIASWTWQAWIFWMRWEWVTGLSAPPRPA